MPSEKHQCLVLYVRGEGEEGEVRARLTVRRQGIVKVPCFDRDELMVLLLVGYPEESGRKVERRLEHAIL